MKRTLLVFLMNSIALLAFVQGQTQAQSPAPSAVSIIPVPVRLQMDPGHFTLPQSILIEAPDRTELVQTLEELRNRLSIPTGAVVTLRTKPAPAATIRLMLVKGGNDSLGAEGYRLSVKENNITIRAQQPAGLFYGVQTLLQ